ncbi:uncharacterized protein PV09_01604 [Verruconis gallopava]|uniref:G-protein coupled receptors family 2 profile 2 domain-containing protein n=1 Tax=Verruconis gallopava TaxID=253628 RepID=A0A0D2B8S6_9PEZI|nr:uncharacterized protein PV09_01604 [Verruconis gallopava]KIW07664.1 hypothetical protein PV09_01604 [Verruconis gallopava]
MSQVSHPVGNGTDLNGACPAPFLDASKFTSGGGHIAGRFCAKISQLPGDPECCLPCPATDWLYPQSFTIWYRVSEAISAVGLAMCVFLLLSWAILPPNKTRRHYLSVCLTLGVVLEALAFVIPLAVRPKQCYDQITPNDMYTSLTCAWSGAFIVGGGLIVVVWTFMRALSMHLQICWDIVPGQMFFYVSQGVGWGVAGVLFTVTMTITGVSFRFGEACHVNPNNSMADFWGPLLGISVAAAVIQILTFFYCIKVYLKNAFSDSPPATTGSSGLPSYHSSSIRTASARAVYQRVKKVLWLQWRSITIVMFVLVDIIFFAIVWVRMDNTLETVNEGDIDRFLPFLTCLFVNGEAGKAKCFADGQKALTNESTALAILMLLALIGVQAGLLLIRGAMFTGWYELVKSKFSSNREFVSLDAKIGHQEHSRFELVKVGTPVVEEDDVSPLYKYQDYGRRTDAPGAPGTQGTQVTQDTQGQASLAKTDRPYRQNTMSFSGPRPPSASGQRVDPRVPQRAPSTRDTQWPNYSDRNPYNWGGS